MSRLLPVLAIAALTSLTPTRASGAEVVGGAWRERLIELVQAAVSSSPALHAMELDVEAARHVVPQTAALPEPELEAGLRDVPITDPSLTRDDFTMQTVTYRQALPRRGERSARRALASAELQGLIAEHRGHRVEVAADVAEAFFALAAVDQKLAILEDVRVRLQNAASAATERLRVGQGGQADVLRASLELTQIEEMVVGLEAERDTKTARINALLTRGVGEPIPRLPVLPEDLDSQLDVPALEELIDAAEQRSPRVLAAQSSVAVAEGELALTAVERRPSWMLEGYYGRRPEFDDLVGVSAGISLPWTRRKRLEEERAEKEAGAAAARVRVEAARTPLRAQIGETYAEIGRMRRELRLYRDVILPQAEIHFDSAREAYAVGRVDFLTFSSAASDLERYRLAVVDRTAGIGQAMASLQRATGLPILPGTPDPGVDDETH